MGKCKDCKWWKEFGPDESGGHCHRHAPKPEVGWPITVENDWCGEFEAKEKK